MSDEYKVNAKITAYHWKPDLDRIAELEAKLDAVKAIEPVTMYDRPEPSTGKFLNHQLAIRWIDLKAAIGDQR